MSSIRLCVGVTVFLSVARGWSQESAPRTLNELLLKAMQNHRDLLAARQRIDEARGLLRLAGVGPPPTLEAGGASGRPVGTAGEDQFSAGLSREFETAGKRSKRVLLAGKEIALAESEYDEKVRQLRYEILTRYADYFADGEKLKILDGLIDLHRRSLDVTRARVEKGDAAVLEQNLITVELRRAEAQRATVSGRLRAAAADLTRLAGVESGEILTLTLEPSSSRIPLEGLAEKALDQRPDLRMMRLLRQRGEAETNLAEAEARPNVTVSAQFSRTRSRFGDQFGLTSSGGLTPLRDRDNILAVRVSAPLFSRKRNLGNIEAAAARTRAAQLRAEYLERAIPLEIDAAWQRLESSRIALATLDGEVVPLARANLDVIRQAHQLGQLRLLDALAEQRRVLDAQLGSIDVQAEVRRSFAELEKAVGGPIQ